MYRINSFLASCIYLCISGTAFSQPKQQTSTLSTSAINFELDIQISLFDFPCKVVVFQNNGSGAWDTTLSSIIPNGNGIIKGKLNHEDYVLLKMFPADEPDQMVAMQKFFLQDGRSILKWDDAEAKFKREGSKLDDLFFTFQNQYSSLEKLKGQAQEAGRQSQSDSLSKKSLILTKVFFNEHTNDAISPYVLTSYLSHEISSVEYENLYSSLSKEIQLTGWGINAKAKAAKMKTIEIGAKAPAFNAIAIDSSAISLENYKGKYVFVDFWASWCEPCLKELPYIEKLNSLIDPSKLVIISISTDQSKEKFKNALIKHPQKWACILDVDNHKLLSESYDVSRLPSNFLINDKGEIIAKDLRGEELVKIVMSYTTSK
jgi:thiol-disulfide isomerase/thioredoxin